MYSISILAVEARLEAVAGAEPPLLRPGELPD